MWNIYSKIHLLSLSLFIIPVFTSANPLRPTVSVSEIYFDDNDSWIIEIDNRDGFINSSNKFLIENSLGDISITTTFEISDFILLTNENMDEPISINRLGDSVLFYTDILDDPDLILLGNVSGSYLHDIQKGQSVARIQPYRSSCYIDNSPTIGAENDFEGSIGKIYGFIYDLDKEPLSGVYFFINEGLSGRIEIGDDGAYYTDLLCRSYALKDLDFYASASIKFPMSFQENQFTIKENDSLRIDFNRILSSTNRIEPKRVLFSNYPNPVKEETYFVFDVEDTVNDFYLISIYDINARLVDSFLVSESGFRYDCSHLPNGSYVYTLSTNSKIISSNKLQVLK